MEKPLSVMTEEEGPLWEWGDFEMIIWNWSLQVCGYTIEPVYPLASLPLEATLKFVFHFKSLTGQRLLFSNTILVE